MSPFEVVGSIFGLVCVWLTVRENIWCFPTGIANVVLFFVMFLHARLYAELPTYVMYFALNIHGWYEWLHGGPRRTALQVARSPRRELAVIVTAIVAGAPLLGTALATWTDAALPYWDSAITALSFGAQYLLNKKRVENWVLWIIVDVLAVGVYLAKGLYVAAGLYGVFLVLAVMGLRRWVGQLAPITR